MTEFGLLGTVTVTRDGRELPVHGVQPRFVLAMLLLEPGRVVAVDRLAGVLWGEDPPKTARNTLQGCVSTLRRSVEITHRPPGYVLDVDPRRIDLFRFRDLVARARESGDVRLFREALALWRGEALADVDVEGLAGVKAALAEERLTALEDCLELAAGADVVPELRTLIARYPLRERLHGALIVSLQRAGRPGDATQAFHDARRALREALGVEPGPELQRLHEHVLRDTAPDRPVPRQLPPRPPVFSGRAPELAVLGDSPISVISGLGGIGKTWLALHWAYDHLDRFPDGQLFVDLAGFDPNGEPMAAEQAVRGFLAAFGASVPADPQAQFALYRSLIADRRMLIVLDNAREAAQVVPLLPGAPSCTVLITSRDRLHGLAVTHQARGVPLGELPFDEARELLARRIGAHRVAGEPHAVRELLEQCAGLPLALAIVAGRAAMHPAFPLSALVTELREAGLDDPDVGINAVLSSSVAALAPDQAEAFALLGRVPGPDIGTPAAASLLGVPVKRARTLLRALEQRSLLDEHAPGRFRMHDLVRLHAAATPADDDRPLRRLVDFYLHTGAVAGALVEPHARPRKLDEPLDGVLDGRAFAEPDPMRWYEVEYPAVVAAQELAHERGWDSAAWQIAWVLQAFHLRAAPLQTQLAVSDVAMAAAERCGDPAAQALMAHNRAVLFVQLHRHEEAQELLRRSLPWYEDTGDLQGQGFVHRLLCTSLAEQGDHAAAVGHAKRALELAAESPRLRAHVLNMVGWFQAARGEYEDAHAHCQASVDLCREHGFRDGEAAAQDSLGFILTRTGRPHEALERYRDAAALRREVGNYYAEAYTLIAMGEVLASVGAHEEAREVWERALVLCRAQGRAAEVERILTLLS